MIAPKIRELIDDGTLLISLREKVVGQINRLAVAIPASNVKNLVLRPDVVTAIEQGEFHVWPLNHVDEALELFSGVAAANVEEAESFHGKEGARLIEMSEALKEQRAAGGERVITTSTPQTSTPDPRPRLPGQEAND